MFPGSGLSNSGIGFQPGKTFNGQSPNGGVNQTAGSGVQEAIKILSLRLPRVVGANALAPTTLLTSKGSDNPAIDNVLKRVWPKVFPTPPNSNENPYDAPVGPVLPTGDSDYQTPYDAPPFALPTAIDHLLGNYYRSPITPRFIPGDVDRPEDPPPLYETPLPNPFENRSPLPSEHVIQWDTFSPNAWRDYEI